MRERRKLTGRQIFNKKKRREGFIQEKIDELWFRLPMETKRMYERMEEQNDFSATKAIQAWNLNQRNLTLEVLQSKIE